MRKLIFAAIKFYQKAISPYVKAQCKFYPTCSQYAILSIEKYGILKGIAKTFFRILRCNPLSHGGIDFP